MESSTYHLDQNAVHYHFCDKGDMEAMIDRGEFIEYAKVHTNLYGTSVAAVQAVCDSGKTCLLDIDVQVIWASASATMVPIPLVFLSNSVFAHTLSNWNSVLTRTLCSLVRPSPFPAGRAPRSSSAATSMLALSSLRPPHSANFIGGCEDGAPRRRTRYQSVCRRLKRRWPSSRTLQTRTSLTPS